MYYNTIKNNPPPPKFPKPPKTEVDICKEAMYKVGLIQDKKDPRVDGFVVVYKFLKDKYREEWFEWIF